MGLKVDFDVNSIIQTIRLVGRDANDAAYNVLKLEGREIRDLAREYAPIDEGDLEMAIITQPRKGENLVYVGLDPRRLDEHGRSVAAYGTLMHEFQGIGGKGGAHFGLGPRSQRKDAGRGVVGGQFISRAVKERLKHVFSNALIAVKRVTRS